MSPGVDWGAGRYERIAEQLLPAAQTLVASAQLKRGERVLDIGCGTGSVALLAAEAGASAVGIDPAGRLLEVAEGEANARGLQAEFVCGDASALPLLDATVDVALSSFGVIFASDAVAAAREIARVLKASGRALLSAWLPGGPLAMVMGARGKALAQATGETGVARMMAWHDADALARLFAPHGFTVELEQHSTSFTAPSAAAFIESELNDHPAWIAARQALEPRGELDDLRARACTILEQANEEPSAFRITSRYAVTRLQRG